MRDRTMRDKEHNDQVDQDCQDYLLYAICFVALVVAFANMWYVWTWI